jgi:multiple sugar transport system permease protein
MATSKTTGNKKKPLHLIFLAPHLIIFTIFFLIPVVFGIYVSFTSWDLFSSPTFVGLANYKELLFDKSSSFYQQLHTGLFNTFKFVIFSVPFCIIVPLLLAAA